MISVAPEVLNVFTGREGDINAKSGFGVGFGKFVFIEPVSDISFKVVFSDGGFNRAGISEKILSGDFSERDKVFYKRNTDIILKKLIPRRFLKIKPLSIALKGCGSLPVEYENSIFGITENKSSSFLRYCRDKL